VARPRRRVGRIEPGPVLVVEQELLCVQVRAELLVVLGDRLDRPIGREDRHGCSVLLDVLDGERQPARHRHPVEADEARHRGVAILGPQGVHDRQLVRTSSDA
jgi:hypothetical protein